MNVGHLHPNKQRAVRIMLANHDPSLRWRGKLAVPDRCHPLIKELFRRINEEKATMHELAGRAGCIYSTISDWRYRRNPNLVTLTAVANALGYDIALVPLNDGRRKKAGAAE
jgi:hypothetical protein